MKNKIPILIYFLLISFCSSAQAQWTEQWVKGISGTLVNGNPPTIKLHQDQFNNVYVSVSTINTNYSSSPIFQLFKLDSSGQQQWSKAGNAFITGIVFDKSNATYISGIFSGTATIFGSTITSKGKKDIYLTKLDPAGNLLWMKSFGGPGNDESGGLLITDKQKLIVTGTVRENPDFNDTLITSDIRCKPFIGQIDINGKVEHIKTWKADPYLTSDTNYSHLDFIEPAIDSIGNIVAIWRMTDIVVNSEWGPIYGQPTSWEYVYVLAKFDSLFKTINVRGLGDDYMQEFSGLKIDRNCSPHVIHSQSSQYFGTWVRIQRFDSVLSNIKNYAVPLITDLPGTNFSYKWVSAICFDLKNNLLSCSNDQADYYGSSPVQYDNQLVIQSFDTAGIQIAYKAYKLDSNSVFPYDIQTIRNSNDFYITGYTASGYRFTSDSVAPGSVFIAKYYSNVTGLRNNYSSACFSIYPNPSSGIFMISANHQFNYTICIYDVLGNCIMNKTELKNDHQIDLSNQPKGIYFVEIVSDQLKTVKKICLQ